VAERTALHEVTAAAGAAFVEQAGWLVPEHFGDPAEEYRQARTGAVVFDVSPRSKVMLRGADAAKFLHNLCSNDIIGLADGATCEAFLLNIKARVIAHVLVTRPLGGPGTPTLWLDATPGFGDKIVKHLDHFLISEQVEIVDWTAELAQLHLAGPLARTIGPGAMPLGAILRRNDALGLPGLDFICPRAEAPALWQALVAAGARPAGLRAYEPLRIEAGTPEYGRDVDETVLAPEVGRTRQAISYTKGCYLGQEPVVRIRDLGQVNRLLLGLEIQTDQPLPTGAKITRAGEPVGHLTSSALSPRLGRVVALGYLRRGSQEPGTVLAVETAAGDSVPAVAVTLPFPGSGAPPAGV
jgi:folate-binding protein YgfZ